MGRIVENGQTYVIRQGQRIAVNTIDTPAPKRRKRFEPEWVKLPMHWIKALRRSRSAATYALALVILAAEFKRQQMGGEIVLSSTTTQMSKTTRIRAAKELAELGLIQLDRSSGNQAYRVSSTI
jgi:hypothetical protein